MALKPLQRVVIRLVVLVVLLDLVAIGAYTFFHIATASRRVRTAYLLVWTAATLAIVLPVLIRVRTERNAMRRRR